MITSPYLVGRDRYERSTEGWVDNAYADPEKYLSK